MSNFLFSSNVKKAACVGLVALSLTLLTNEVSANKALDNVNFRSSAEIKADNKIGETIKKGTEITPIEIGNDWLSTKIGDQIGYITTEYVSNDTFNAKVKEGSKNVNVRLSASVGDNKYIDPNDPNKKKVVQINGGKKLNIIGEEGDFYKVYIDSLKPLYVSKDFVIDERPKTPVVETKEPEVKVEEPKVEETKVEEVKVEEKKTEDTKIEEVAVPEAIKSGDEFFINERYVNFRKSNSTSSASIRKFNPGEKVTFIEEVNGTEGFAWYKVTDKNGVTGYVCKNYVSSVKSGNEIVEFAMTFLGTPYVYGKSDPAVGFDCSGLTCYVFNQLYGVTLPRSSNDQFNTACKEYKNCTATVVGRDDLIPGDIVCYWGHVAIYVGEGKVIHAPVPGRFVCIESINMGGQSFRGGIRITPNK